MKKLLLITFLLFFSFSFAQQKEKNDMVINKNKPQTTLSLVSAYPNPFNVTTKINFQSTKVQLVEFTVKNLLGKTVYFETVDTKVGYNSILFNRDDLVKGMKEAHSETEKQNTNEFIEGSILEHSLLQELFEKNHFEYVFHLAAYAAEGLSHFIKRFNYANNVIGSVNLINESINHNIKCFVFTSSIAVYGSNQPPMREDMVPSPEDSYGIAKFTVEQELKISHDLFGLDYIIFRPHNVYGEHQNIGDRYRNVIGIFMNRLMQGQDIPIFGDSSRSSTHRTCFVRGITPYKCGTSRSIRTLCSEAILPSRS